MGGSVLKFVGLGYNVSHASAGDVKVVGSRHVDWQAVSRGDLDIPIFVGGPILKHHSETQALLMSRGRGRPIGNSSQMQPGLGVKSRTVLDLPNRYLMDGIEARKKVAAVIRKIQPQILFLPYWIDAHPDHIQTTQIGEAARFYAKLTKSDIPGEPCYPAHIYYYLCSHLRVHATPSFILDISKEFEKKLQAAWCYQSQFAYDEARWKHISNSLTAQNQYYGNLIRVGYGEPFMSREQVGLKDIRDII